MKKYRCLFGLAALLPLFLPGCYDYPETIPLDTKICVETSHHYFPIPDATVRLANLRAGALDIVELQIEGGKRLEAAAFLAGRKIAEGAILGSA